MGLAVCAPSGDNSQPWRFVVRDDGLHVYNVPGKDSSPYNFKERGSFFAHGALMENIVIASSPHGYEAAISLFPSDNDPSHVAKIKFEDAGAAKDPLAPFIEARVTNRKPYRKMPLLPGHREALVRASERYPFGTLAIIEEPREIARVGKLVSLSDRLIFEDLHIHSAIFDSIRWTEAEEEKRRGLFIGTLELPPPARLVFRMLKNDRVLRLLNRVGISRFIASQSAGVYGSSSALGMITMPDDTPEGFVGAGRLFERVWLRAAERGISIQPITALAYLAQRVAHGAAGDMDPGHRERIMRTERAIRDAFGGPTGTIAMLFRMGYGGSPSARSRKSLPDITYAG